MTAQVKLGFDPYLNWSSQSFGGGLGGLGPRSWAHRDMFAEWRHKYGLTLRRSLFTHDPIVDHLVLCIKKPCRSAWTFELFSSVLADHSVLIRRR